MNKKVYPYMGWFGIGVSFILISIIMVWFLITFWEPANSQREEIIFTYFVMIPTLIFFVPLQIFIFACNLIMTARPVRCTEKGFSAGWIFRENIAWDEITAIGLARGSEIPKEERNVYGNGVVSALTQYATGMVYIYILCENEPYIEEHIQKFEMMDFIMLHHARRWVWNWPLQTAYYWSIKNTSGGLDLDEKKLPKKMIIMPLYDDIYAYAKKKVAEAQEAKNAEA